MAGKAAQGGRESLDRERLVRVALALLDEVGLDGLNMRRLAERLGVTAAALYWYVRDKNELLELLADAISAEMPLPDPSGKWRAEIEALARGARLVAASHRDAARILVATLPTGPARLRAIDAILGVLLHAGFTPADAADAAWVLNVYGVGFMLDESLGPQPSAAGFPELAGASGSGARLEGLTHGRLIVERGAVNLALRGDAALPALYQMTYEGPVPEIEADGGTVRVRQRHTRHSSCALTLAGAVSWEIQIEGGATQLSADLTALRLTALRVTGGVNQVTLQLPQPLGTVPLRIDGGVSHLRIERPATAALRLYLHRASSHITLDGLRLSAVGNKTEWASPDYGAAANRYEVELGGAASELTIGATRLELPASLAGTADLEAQMRSWFATQPAHEYPHLVALAGELADPDQDRRFEFGMRLLLDGLERRLAATHGSANAGGAGE